MKFMRTSCEPIRCPRRCVLAGRVDRAGSGLREVGGWQTAGQQLQAPSPPASPACPLQPKMTEYDKRCCCLREIQQTEEKYTDTLASIQQVAAGAGPGAGLWRAEGRG